MGYACWWSIIDIAMKLDMISEEEAEQDYEKLEHIKPSEINTSSRVGSNFVDFFTFNERLNTKGKKHLTFFEFFNKKNELQKKGYIQRLLNYYKNDKNIYAVWYRIFSL